MLRADLLDTVDFRLREVRKNASPFGGVQMVMVGDFLQLPPVVSQNEEKAYKKTHEGKYIFGAEIVKNVR